ncbi:MAG: amidohydrolase family protein [Phycisphaeraceae bacterium]|nr:amidohydrolase family protein [Phycisphaeraceae bacterium]
MMRPGGVLGLLLPLLFLSLGPAASPASAQSRQIPAPAQSRPVVLHSATIHPVSGPTITDGYIVFEDGVITAIGAGAWPTPFRAELLDAGGLHVYPGLISADTQLGLTETASVSVTIDTSELGDMTPEVRAAVAVNPDSDLLPVTRSAGILTAATLPLSGTISGRASLIRMDGWTWEDLTIDPECGLVLNWPRTEPISARWMNRPSAQQRTEIEQELRKIDDFFDDAEAYFRAKATENGAETRTDLRFEAMREAIAGRMPIYIRASSAGQIESAVAWAIRRGLSIVIVGGHQADRVTDLLRRHSIPVIVGGTHRLPDFRHDAHDRPFRLPAALHEAGIRFCIASGVETAHERQLPHVAATAAAYGLPKDLALRAVTLSAAEILGVGERLGSLDVGKSATLIVTTGDPLEIMTDVLVAYIDGRRLDLGDRHKMLYHKYAEKYRRLGVLGEE